MSQEKMRESFESVFQPPEEAKWNGTDYLYTGQKDGKSIVAFIEFSGRWQGWQAAINSIEVKA